VDVTHWESLRHEGLRQHIAHFGVMRVAHGRGPCQASGCCCSQTLKQAASRMAGTFR
jgi:hypothetical protein